MKRDDKLGLAVLKSFYDKGMYTAERNRELEQKYDWTSQKPKPPAPPAKPRREDYPDYEAYEKARWQWEYEQGDGA